MIDYGDFLVAMIESSGSDLSGDFTVEEMEKYLIEKEGYSQEELAELYSQFNNIEDDEPKKQSESDEPKKQSESDEPKKQSESDKPSYAEVYGSDADPDHAFNDEDFNEFMATKYGFNKSKGNSETNTGDKDEKRVKNDDYSDDKYDDIKKAINSFIESTGSAPTISEYNKIIADLKGPEKGRQSKASPASDRDDYSVSEVDVNDDGSVFDDSYDVYDDVTSTGHISDENDDENDDWTDVKNTLKDLR